MWLIHHGSFQDQVSVQPDTCPPSAARAWPTWLAGIDKERVQALSETPLPANRKLSSGTAGKSEGIEP